MNSISRAGIVVAAFSLCSLVFGSIWNASAQVCAPGAGRSYNRIVSVHPNERELLFSECGNVLDNERGCFVLKFDKQKKKLARYDLPTGYDYDAPSFSPSGNWVVAVRWPSMPPDMNEAEWQEINLRTEIVKFRTDGTQFAVVPLAPGYKAEPVMSPDERRIAFLRGRVMPISSPRQKIRDLDVWEVDLANGKEALFAAEYQFSGLAQIQYLDGKTLLINAERPYAVAHSDPEEAAAVFPAYDIKNRYSSIYRLQRADKNHVLPIQTGFDSAQRASVDRVGNMYFDGTGQLELLHRLSPDGALVHRMLPEDKINQIISMKTIPSGRVLVCVLACGKPWQRVRTITLLDFETNVFTPLAIPPLQSSLRIPITLAQ